MPSLYGMNTFILNRNKGLISTTCFAQLLHVQIPKSQTKTISCIGALGSVVNFINILRERFFCTKKCAPKIQRQKVRRKKLFKDFCTKKVRVKRWWNWHLRQFHQCFFARFFHTNVLFGSFSSYVLALAPKFRTKNARVNVDEIDGCRRKSCCWWNWPKVTKRKKSISLRLWQYLRCQL